MEDDPFVSHDSPPPRLPSDDHDHDHDDDRLHPPSSFSSQRRRQSSSSREVHRFSSFDSSSLFSLTNSSPGQVRRALEAHLTETERRLEDASRLGTSLVEQQRELSEKLHEFEQKDDNQEIGPELSKKLAQLEKEVNDLGRETAKATLGARSKPIGSINTGSASSAILSTGSNDDLRSHGSFSTISSAHLLPSDSPSVKSNAASRRERNKPATPKSDYRMFQDIGDNLIAQVRYLQRVLAERDEELKNANLERSRLELEADGFQQRIHILDESEQRYKDENWTLELRNQDMLNQISDLTEREEKLTSSLKTLQDSQGKLQRELDEVKAVNNRLAEDQLAAQKHHDTEMHALRRSLNTSETSRADLQKKVTEVTSQNQELVRAVAMKFREQENTPVKRHDLGVVREHDSSDSSPEGSPPPSPGSIRPTPLRNKTLESETLKSSLHHAQRMIQSLKNTIHKEKSEKIELKRMLQEARDEVEGKRKEPGTPGGLGSTSSGNLRRPKSKSIVFKKPPASLLGKGRRPATEIEEVKDHDPLRDDPDWEDHPGQGTIRASKVGVVTPGPPPAKMLKTSHGRQRLDVAAKMDEDESVSPRHVSTLPRNEPTTPTSRSKGFMSETDTDAAFETANERDTATESEAFQTGVEDMSDNDTIYAGSSTETETGTATQTPSKTRPRTGLAQPISMYQRTPRRRQTSGQHRHTRSIDSFQGSTASTSDDDDEDMNSKYANYNRALGMGLGFGAGLTSGFSMGSPLEHRSGMHSQSRQQQQQQQQPDQDPPRYKLRMSHSRRMSSKPSIYGGSSDTATNPTLSRSTSTRSIGDSIRTSPLSRTRTGSVVSTMGGATGALGAGQSLFAELDENDFEGAGSGSDDGTEGGDPDAAYRVASPVAAAGGGVPSMPSTPQMGSGMPPSVATSGGTPGRGGQFGYPFPGQMGRMRRSTMTAMVDVATMTVGDSKAEVEEAVAAEVQRRLPVWNLVREESKRAAETVPAMRVVGMPQYSVHGPGDAAAAVETAPVAKVRVYSFTPSGLVSEVQSVPVSREPVPLSPSGVHSAAATAPVEKMPASLSHVSAGEFAETRPVTRAPTPLSTVSASSAGSVETAPLARMPVPLSTAAVYKAAETQPLDKKPPSYVVSHADDKTFTQTLPIEKQPPQLVSSSAHQSAQTEPVTRPLPTLAASTIQGEHTLPVGKQPVELRHAPSGSFGGVHTEPTERLSPPAPELGHAEHSHVFTEPVARKRDDAVVAGMLPVPLQERAVPELGHASASTLSAAETMPRASKHASAAAAAALAGAGAAGAAALGALAEHAKPAPSFARSAMASDASTAPVARSVTAAPAVKTPQPPQYSATSALGSSETVPLTPRKPVVEYARASPDLRSAAETSPVDKKSYAYVPQLGVVGVKGDVETAPVAREVHGPELSVSGVAGTKGSVETAPVAREVHVPELSVSSVASTKGIAETAPVAREVHVPELSVSSVASIETTPVERKVDVPELDVSCVSAVETTPVVREEPVLQLGVSGVEGAETSPVEKREDVVELTLAEVKSVETTPVAVTVTKPAFTPSSAIATVETLPVEAKKHIPQLAFANAGSVETAPASRVIPELAFNRSAHRMAAETVPVAAALSKPALGVSVVSYAETAPVARPAAVVMPDVPEPQLEASSVAAVETVPFSPEKPVQEEMLVSMETVPLQFAPSDRYVAQTLPVEAKRSDKLLGIAVGGLGVAGAGLASMHDASSASRPRTAMRDGETSTSTEKPKSKPAMVDTAEGSTQTIVTAHQIDQLLIERHDSRRASAALTPVLNGASSGLAFARDDESARTTPTPKAKAMHGRTPSGVQSVTSAKGLPFTSPHANRSHVSLASSLVPSLSIPGPASDAPPLPADHKQAIANATERLSHDSSVQYGTAVVGQTYRLSDRPHTPADQTLDTRRPTHTPSTLRRGSHHSHRSSISSFGDVDMRQDGGVQSHGGYTFESGTDPRMIQAITQTMIGDWLWKYTRNIGRSTLSNTRHQRYVWVHPYTRTLYWSTHDPQADGSQHKSKSIPIESVREVEDENPYPPGLCTKSLEIVTPARTVKFTAQTSQRHETWYNALRYLLLRTTPEDDTRSPTEPIFEESVIEQEPPTLRSPPRRPNSLRMSMSATNSPRTPRVPARANSRLGTPNSRRASSIRAPSLLSHSDTNSLRAKRHPSVSRLSSIFHQHTHAHAGKAGSFRTRRVRQRPSTADISTPHNLSVESHPHQSSQSYQQRPSIDASVQSSTLETRSSLLYQPLEVEGLENVRACCGGKHDVGSLCRPARHHHASASAGR